MNKLHEIREEKGVSLRELAKLAGVSKTQINEIENGQSDPTLKTMCLIAKALNMKIEDIFWCDWPVDIDGN